MEALSLSIAYLSPMPPERTGIADYSVDLLPYLSQLANVTAFVDDERSLETSLSGVALRPMRDYASRRREFDVAVYQMGNSAFHAAIYRHATHSPGISVLHDYSLHHLIGAMTAWRGDFAGYARELGYALGAVGVQQAREIRMGWRDYALFDQPLNERLCDSSLGVIVHSQFAARQIKRRRPNQKVVVVSQPITLIEPAMSVRRQLGWPDDVFVAGCAGQITVEKRIDLVLKAFARLKQSVPSARCLLVGQVPDWYPIHLDELIEQLDVRDSVIRIGYAVDLDHFRACLAAMDVCVSLRYPTVGETSASLLRTMAVGTPAVVSNVGWYAELPDAACIKLDQGDHDEAALAQKLIELANDRSKREALGREARLYVARECAPEKIAQVYIDLAQAIAGHT